ncbi:MULTISPECIES: hypothetical protein [Streptacidiphilus]|uniref:MmcQ/YjbR family DNA-binding protein n=1 Tax=Streptacidiphilus cavernicola TaxID=3342716 RepID=A0ABV6UWG4_9ACTN|nr:hypothetical protein [Streptacidiphilus jeojiense]
MNSRTEHAHAGTELRTALAQWRVSTRDDGGCGWSVVTVPLVDGTTVWISNHDSAADFTTGSHTGWLAVAYPDMGRCPEEFTEIYRSHSADFARDTAELVAVVVQFAGEHGGSGV